MRQLFVSLEQVRIVLGDINYMNIIKTLFSLVRCSVIQLQMSFIGVCPLKAQTNLKTAMLPTIFDSVLHSLLDYHFQMALNLLI